MISFRPAELRGRCAFQAGPRRVLRVFEIRENHAEVSRERKKCQRVFPRFVEVQLPTAALPGWGGRIRTSAWGNQNPLPYHLATPQLTGRKSGGTIAARIPSGNAGL